MGGKQAIEMEVGAIFAKYYGLAKLADEIQDRSGPARNVKIANIPATVNADAVMVAKASKEQYTAAI